MKPHEIDKKFIVLGIGLILFSLYTRSLNLKNLVAIFVMLDFSVAIVAIIRGIRRNKPGITVGGVICLLMALSSARSAQNPCWGDLIILLLSGALGVGSVVLSGSQKVFK